jgi:hypothetical protein
MTFLRALDDAMDSIFDVLSFILDVADSLADFRSSKSAVAAEPPKWCRSRAEDEPTYTGKGVWSSVQLDLHVDTRAVKRYDWTYEALRMYRPYEVLQKERKLAKCNTKERQTLSFLDLPGEIRTQIYSLALVFGSIETETRFRSRAHTIECTGKPPRDAFEMSHQYKTWLNTVKPALGLLRLNKQINPEAASVFYGHNEFRFTGPNGRDTLEAFCRTIGEANTRRLAKITHHVTFDNRVYRNPCITSHKLKKRSQIYQACYQKLPVWLCKSNFGEEKISQERWKDLPCWLKWTGLHMQGTIESADFDFVRALVENDGGLREYHLVLPHDLHIKPRKVDRYLRCIFDHVVNTNLHGAAGRIKITLVLLDLNFRTLDRTVGITSSTLPLMEAYELRGEFVELAFQWGWEVVMANTVDKATGHYVCSAPLRSVDEWASKVNYEVSRTPHRDM